MTKRLPAPHLRAGDAWLTWAYVHPERKHIIMLDHCSTLREADRIARYNKARAFPVLATRLARKGRRA